MAAPAPADKPAPKPAPADKPDAKPMDTTTEDDCMTKCQRDNMARAVSAEVITADCERHCAGSIEIRTKADYELSLSLGHPAQVGQGIGDAPIVAQIPLDGQRLAAQPLGFIILSFQRRHLAQNIQGNAGPIAIARILADLQALFQRAFGLIILSQMPKHRSQIVECKNHFLFG